MQLIRCPEQDKLAFSRKISQNVGWTLRICSVGKPQEFSRPMLNDLASPVIFSTNINVQQLLITLKLNARHL